MAAAASPLVPLEAEASALLDGGRSPRFVLLLPPLSLPPLLTVRFVFLSFFSGEIRYAMHDSSRLFTYFCPLDAERSVLLLFAVVGIPPARTETAVSPLFSWRT